ncbi:MAG: Holliday junction resolvase RuvX [Chloroflexi bacterium]|nr:Holliday junction resolvase RuvX [Chloroflexota bacterium]MCL5104166.1 Holliday junction resolvase RuvX [Armatimonadota bacterium]
MPRIVALDVGDATIGVAAADELKITVNPIRTIRRSKSVKTDLREVEAMLQELDAATVVVGLPLGPEGEEGPQALKVRDFVERLARRVKVPVETWDERFSTVDAEDILLRLDVSRAKRREIIDQVAAVVILESYLGEKGLQNVDCRMQNEGTSQL